MHTKQSFGVVHLQEKSDKITDLITTNKIEILLDQDFPSRIS